MNYNVLEVCERNNKINFAVYYFNFIVIVNFSLRFWISCSISIEFLDINTQVRFLSFICIPLSFIYWIKLAPETKLFWGRFLSNYPKSPRSVQLNYLSIFCYIIVVDVNSRGHTHQVQLNPFSPEIFIYKSRVQNSYTLNFQYSSTPSLFSLLLEINYGRLFPSSQKLDIRKKSIFKF